ncbi:MAG TPA: hypothetical protein VGW38_08490 [Chloroflexota bacterium]|nr:hypothetical protein [Chloroflexota bacterium]
MKQRLMLMLALLAGALLFGTGLALPATALTPASSLEADYPEIRLEATDYAFTVSSHGPAGLTRVTMINSGHEPHHVQLMQLAEGQSSETLQTAMSQDPAAIFGLGRFVGGPAAVAPGEQSQVILDLEPGQYVALCFVQSPDGVPHLAKGMVQTFEVPGTRTTVPEPEAAGTVVMEDFTFELPTHISAGRQVWEVVNEGAQPHEIVLLKLAPGVSPEQAMEMLLSPAAGQEASPEVGQTGASHDASPAGSPAASGPPPFQPVGGMQAMATGLRGWAVLDLEPGTYVAVCGVPDPQSGQPHLMLGMVATFTVE